MNLFFANIAYASTDTIINNIKTNILDPFIGILFAFALVLFLWGVAKFLMSAENDADLKQGKNNMIWGLVGMFIMISVIGIMNLIKGTIGI